MTESEKEILAYVRGDRLKLIGVMAGVVALASAIVVVIANTGPPGAIHLLWVFAFIALTVFLFGYWLVFKVEPVMGEKIRYYYKKENLKGPEIAHRLLTPFPAYPPYSRTKLMEVIYAFRRERFGAVMTADDGSFEGLMVSEDPIKDPNDHSLFNNPDKGQMKIPHRIVELAPIPGLILPGTPELLPTSQ